MNAYPKVDTQWFQGRLADLRISQRKLAGLLGMDPGALSLALHGKRKLSAEEVSDLADLLKVDATEVLSRVGAKAPAKRAATERAFTPTRKTLLPEMAGEFEAEFLKKWIDIGMLIVRAGTRV